MWVSVGLGAFSELQRFPSIRNPVPQSRMNCVPSGATKSRQGVFPPKRQVVGSTVGVEPRTPQKVNLATGELISIQTAKYLGKWPENGQRDAFSDSGSGYRGRQRIHGRVLSTIQQQKGWRLQWGR